MKFSSPSVGRMTQGATPEVNSMRSWSAGAARRASMRYLLLNPISSPWPSPETGHWSAASPIAVRVVMDTIPSPKTHRSGDFSFSLMMRDTRSMEDSRVRLSTWTCMVLFRGMALR